MDSFQVRRTAGHLLARHGAQAWRVAASAYRSLMVHGDFEGAAAWRRVAVAIAETGEVDRDDVVHTAVTWPLRRAA